VNDFPLAAAIAGSSSFFVYAYNMPSIYNRTVLFFFLPLIPPPKGETQISANIERFETWIEHFRFLDY
jgi:hypothetical protein